MQAVFGIQLLQQGVNPVAQPGGFGQRLFPLNNKQIEDRSLILSVNPW
jgi:hypothetical protein